jgi:hypothetical protein
VVPSRSRDGRQNRRRHRQTFGSRADEELDLETRPIALDARLTMRGEPTKLDAVEGEIGEVSVAKGPDSDHGLAAELLSQWRAAERDIAAAKVAESVRGSGRRGRRVSRGRCRRGRESRDRGHGCCDAA